MSFKLLYLMDYNFSPPMQLIIVWLKRINFKEDWKTIQLIWSEACYKSRSSALADDKQERSTTRR
jgi:hypothetical protein